MAGDWSDLTKRVARGIAEVRKTTGSELVAESQPVALAGRVPAGPVIQLRRRRAEDTHRFVLILPFGEGEVRVELDAAGLCRADARDGPVLERAGAGGDADAGSGAAEPEEGQ